MTLAPKRKPRDYFRIPPGMSFDERDAYVEAASFLPATGRTLDGLTGAIFRKPPIIDGASDDLLNNADLQGTPLAIFAKSVVREVIAMGRTGVLVDVDNRTQRSYLSHYWAEDILNWRMAVIDGRPTLVLLVLSETLSRPREEDRFATERVQRYRVLELIRSPDHESPVLAVSIYEKRPGNDLALVEGPIIPKRRGQPLDFIPFASLAPNSLGVAIEDSPLLGLANKNISHLKTSAEVEHAAFHAGVPQYFVTGDMSGDGIELLSGSAAVWQLEKGATAGILQGAAENIGALTTLLELKEKQMAVLGARLLEPQKSGVESAEAIGLRHRGENSLLASIADTCGRGLGRALSWAAWWGGTERQPDGNATVQLNTDFVEAPMSADQVVKFVAAWQSGGLPLEALHHNLARGEALPEGMTLDDYREGLENDGPAAVFMNGETEDFELDEGA